MTNRGDIVIDCFAGSGSTLLAAEVVGRRCRAIEVDGPYCDVIIRRWQEMAGSAAVLESTGETFDEVERTRFEETEDGAQESTPANRREGNANKGGKTDDRQ